MKVLVINCGSSTIKYQLIDMAKDEVIAKGRCDKIGYEDSNLIYKNLNYLCLIKLFRLFSLSCIFPSVYIISFYCTHDIGFYMWIFYR